jgi:hypothetical protein
MSGRDVSSDQLTMDWVEKFVTVTNGTEMTINSSTWTIVITTLCIRAQKIIKQYLSVIQKFTNYATYIKKTVAGIEK